MVQTEEETRVEKWDREGGKSCGRGDDSLSRENLSLELDDCPIHGFSKLCFVQFCRAREEGRLLEI